MELKRLLPNGTLAAEAMARLARAVSNHSGPFVPAHHWQHLMLHDGSVYATPNGVSWPDQMRGGLIDLLGAVARDASPVEFILYNGDVLDTEKVQLWAKRHLGLPVVPILSYTAPAKGSCLAQLSVTSEAQRAATFLVPCYYDTVIDDLCAAPVPPFEEVASSIHHRPSDSATFPHPLVHSPTRLLT